jgi:hypothetical protein
VLEVMWMIWKGRSRKVFDDVTHRHGHPPHRPPTSLGVSGEMTNGHRPPQRMACRWAAECASLFLVVTCYYVVVF